MATMFCAIAGFGATPADETTGRLESNRDVRPILTDRCFSCHGPDRAARKSPLRLDQAESARNVLSAGDPAHSKLYLRVTSTDTATRMPPAYMGRDRLTDAEIDTLRRWIEQGATYQPHWSLIAPRRPAAPAVKE